MATAGENALLSQLLDAVGAVAKDVADVKTTSALTAQAVTQQTSQLADHEVRLRESEKLRDAYVTKAALWRVAGICAAISSGFTGVLVAKLIG